MMQLDEILRLADKHEIEFLSGDVLAAISAIGLTPDVDRQNPQAVAAHNAAVLTGQDAIDGWMKNSFGEALENKRCFLRDADLRGPLPPSPASPGAFQVLSGAEGHTHPISTTVLGTGLLRQGKTPRYDGNGHIT